MISAGRLRERVTIQEKDLVPNGQGGRRPRSGQEQWVASPDGETRAAVDPLRGSEAVLNGIGRSTQIYRVTLRSRAGLTAANRLIWHSIFGDVALDIAAPPALSRDRRDMILTCQSGVPS